MTTIQKLKSLLKTRIVQAQNMLQAFETQLKRDSSEAFRTYGMLGMEAAAEELVFMNARDYLDVEPDLTKAVEGLMRECQGRIFHSARFPNTSTVLGDLMDRFELQARAQLFEILKDISF